MTDSAAAPVALVLVSHSHSLAVGAVELASQMAPTVLLVAAGGLEDGGLGTSFELITAALERATASGRSAAVLTDLGSAVLTTESALEFLDADVAARIRLADAPFVEGAVAAAVTAEGGGDLATVLRAAEDAAGSFATSLPAHPAEPEPKVQRAASVARATARLRNPLGLHARPAARLARTAASFDASVTVGGADASSVLALISLGAVGGAELAVTATGPQARAALAAVVAEIEEGFGEA